jgi:hypothetical protein
LDFIQTQEDENTEAQLLKKSHKESKISSSQNGGEQSKNISDIDNLNELFNSEKLLRKKTCEKAFQIATEIVNSHSHVKNTQVQQYEEALD